MFSFTDSSCLQDSILFLKAHWLGTWNSLDTECQAISWMNHHLKTVYTIQSIKLGHKKKQLLIFLVFWIGNDPRNTTHQYNGCCCVAAISLWETFRMLLASGFSAEVGHLRRDLLFWNPANHRNIRIAAKTEMKSYIEPLHGHLPPSPFHKFQHLSRSTVGVSVKIHSEKGLDCLVFTFYLWKRALAKGYLCSRFANAKNRSFS